MGDTGLEPGRGAQVGRCSPCLLGWGDLRFAEICSERNLEWNHGTSFASRAAASQAIEILSGIYPGVLPNIVTGSRSDLAVVQGNLGDVYLKGKLVMTQSDGMSALATNIRQHLNSSLPMVEHASDLAFGSVDVAHCRCATRHCRHP
jgi:hypothetical protein